MKKIKVASAAIIHDQKLLAAQRLRGTYKGFWELPGGKIEVNETGEQAAIRECQEELSITVKPFKHLKTITHNYPDFLLEMEIYCCLWCDGKITLHDHSHYQWLTLDSLYSVTWLPADYGFLDDLKEYLK